MKADNQAFSGWCGVRINQHFDVLNPVIISLYAILYDCINAVLYGSVGYMKIILDTNIIVNVLLSPSRQSASYKVFEMCLENKLEPQVGSALFSEYEDVLSRPEIQQRAKYTPIEIETLLDGFLNRCTWARIHYLWRPNLKDEGDNHLVDLAVASNAKWIVTQNIKDLESGELKFGFRSITPEAFLEVLHGNNHISNH